jgi:hypothetical protein
MPAAGGPNTRVTQGGNEFVVKESVAGKSLFFARNSALQRVPAARGPSHSAAYYCFVR